MTAVSVPNPSEREGQQIPLGEWLRLRRPPRPEFYDSAGSLPQSLYEAARPVLPPKQAVRGALLLPGEYYARKRVQWEWTPERALIFLDEGVVHVAGAAPGAPAHGALIDAGALLYLRSSLLLLYGLLEFRADCGGAGSQMRVEYNTVIWESLKGPLARFVAAAGPRPEPAAEAEINLHNAAIIKSLPFKFANGVRYYTLGPGERLHAAIFQPAIWERHGLVPRQVTPNTLLALTDRKLVLIEESRSSFWQRRRSDMEYGWIFTYIPSGRVVDMSVTTGVRWSELKMRLEWGAASDERAFLLEPAVAAGWRQAWQEAGGS